MREVRCDIARVISAVVAVAGAIAREPWAAEYVGVQIGGGGMLCVPWSKLQENVGSTALAGYFHTRNIDTSRCKTGPKSMKCIQSKGVFASRDSSVQF
jgi:hypothetical protein